MRVETVILIEYDVKQGISYWFNCFHI